MTPTSFARPSRLRSPPGHLRFVGSRPPSSLTQPVCSLKWVRQDESLPAPLQSVGAPRVDRFIPAMEEVLEICSHQDFSASSPRRFEHMPILRVLERNDAHAAERQGRAHVGIAGDGVCERRCVCRIELKLSDENQLQTFEHAPRNHQLQRLMPRLSGPRRLHEGLARRSLPACAISKEGGAPDVEVEADPDQQSGRSTTARYPDGLGEDIVFGGVCGQGRRSAADT